MIHLALTRGGTALRGARVGAIRARGRHAAYRGEREALLRKDFSAVPVCGSVRPLASQRRRAAVRVD